METSIKKLLVVDDEFEIVDFAKCYYESKGGWQIFTATTSQEALEIAEREKPQIIFLDIRLSRNQLDGFEVLAKIREISPKSKVIIITAIEDGESRERAKKLGAAEYLTKPVSLDHLDSVIVKKLKEISEGW